MLKAGCFAALSLILLALPSFAADNAVARPIDWTQGGALSDVSGRDGGAPNVWQLGSITAGVSPAALSLRPSSPDDRHMQVGGFLAWRGEGYQVDAVVSPAMDGSTVAGLGATAGAMPGEMGTSYGLHLGAAWSMTQRLGPLQSSALGLEGVAVPPTSDFDLSFSVSHTLTPNLHVIGVAAARYPMGMTPDSGSVSSRLMVGAGLGYRF
jgi:hypothetical protein